MTGRNSNWAEALRIALPLLIIGAGVAVFLTLGRGKAESRITDNQESIPLVETVAVQAHTGGIDLGVDGIVVPSSEISVVAEVAGRILYKSPACEAGTYVAKGTVLVKIDPRDYELDVRRLDEEVSQAEVMVAELEVERQNTEKLKTLAEQELQLQQRELARIEKVAQAQRNAVTQTERDAARRAVLAAQRQLTDLDNQLLMFATRRTRLERAADLAKAKRDQVQLALDRTEISAPIDGVIIQDMVEQDSYAKQGDALFAIEDVSTVEVSANLRMEELRWVWQQPVAESTGALDDLGRGYKLPPTPVTVIYRLGGNEYSWQGVLTRFDGLGLDERTRTAPCRVVVEEPRQVNIGGSGSPLPGAPPALVRGMFVSVQIHTRPAVELLSIPEAAVRPGNIVWRVGSNSQMELVEIRPARVTAQQVLFEAAEKPIAAGDRVIVSPLAVANQGMPIREKSSP